MKYSTKNEAVQSMVKEFNAIKYSLIEKAFPYGEGLEEITPTIAETGDSVEYNGDEYDLNDTYGLKVVDINGEKLTLELCDGDDIESYGETIVVDRDDCEIEEKYRDGYLPMWGWMWTLDSCTEHWIRHNLEKTADMGFRIYEDEDGDIYIGIDGAGYDFYAAHWMPLYDAMGLQWHNNN